MRGRNIILQWGCLATLLIFLANFSSGLAQTITNQPANPGLRMKVVKGKVNYMRSGAQVWETNTTPLVEIPLYVGDRVRTPELSQLSVIFSDNSVVTFDERSEFIIQPVTGRGRSRFRLIEGFLSFFHRDQPADLEVETQVALAVVRGTEFALQVTVDNRTIVTVFDGVVDLSNKQGQSIELKNREEGEVEAGKAPVKRAALDAVNVIQWVLYYPGILDDRELDLRADERAALNESLAAYRSGDLLNALYKYPTGRKPDSDSEEIYLAAIYLAAGKVSSAEELFRTLPRGVENNPVNKRNQALAAALKEMIAAVKLQKFERRNPPELATEWLAESYYLQSQRNLGKALEAARIAATRSPEFGFAWARVAELEFGFGRLSSAKNGLEAALRFSPRNAEAIALKGFILASANKIKSAIATFDEAVALDPGLANAWLGRGLSKIRRGDSKGGQEDLLIAASLEPQRGFLRSYLGKAYENSGDSIRAEKELDLAKRLDPADPTAWFYSALLREQQNKINEAIDELEKSQDLNTNRVVYRSQFLLDQDRAVRSANLARIYRDAGMTDWSVREASRAVSDDYANYSAHLFLADSYNQLRDPNRINLRYETPAESEYLIANLLAPVGAGLLSPTVSQNEYAKLFERDRLGVSSSTEYLSRGAWIEQGAQYGTYENSSYLLEGLYRSDNGQRPNNDFEERELRLHLKQQLTPQDKIYLRLIDYKAEAGDVIQYYDPSNANLELRTEERQEPVFHVGYDHQWAPGNHTLLLVGRVADEFKVSDPVHPSYFTIKPVFMGGTTVDAEAIWANLNYRSELKIYTAEAQQIWDQEKFTTIVGALFQFGDIRIRSVQSLPVTVLEDILGYFSIPLSDQDLETHLEKNSFYVYETWKPLSSLRLTAGIAYDRLRAPENYRSPPVSDREESTERLLPKLGIVWDIDKTTVARFAYTRSIAGVDMEQSFRLEPTQVAGFNQSFRSVIPESQGGAEIGAEFETFGLALERKFRSGTYVGITGEMLNSDVDRVLGALEYKAGPDTIFAEPSGTANSLEYSEKSLLLSISQLLGDWVLGGSYRVSRAQIEERFDDIPEDLTPLGFPRTQEVVGVLHEAIVEAIYNHSSGLFWDVQSHWYHQNNSASAQTLDDQDFWHVNAYVGYRFLKRKAEVRIGLLNITDKDYRLNPLNLYNELPRSRTLAFRAQFNF
jgi:Tfp pilus assembly protein PilF